MVSLTSMDEQWQVVSCYLGVGSGWDPLHWEEAGRQELCSDGRRGRSDQKERNQLEQWVTRM